MAEGFTESAATDILSSKIKPTTCVCLSTTTPNKDGSGVTEPPASAGYIRAPFKTVDTSKAAQVANAEYIFIFEALEDCGTVTHACLSNSSTRGDPVFLMGKLTNAITVGAGYVPLIRPHKLVIGLDKEALESYD